MIAEICGITKFFLMLPLIEQFLVLLKIKTKIPYSLVLVKQVRTRNQFKLKRDLQVKQRRNLIFRMVVKEDN